MMHDTVLQGAGLDILLPSVQNGHVEGCSCEERPEYAHVRDLCQTMIGSGQERLGDVAGYVEDWLRTASRP